MSTILVVDDQPVNRQFLKTLLGYFAHQVVEAADGGEALETLRSVGVDLIIADVLMPSMDGYDFLQRVRADKALRGTPVIFFTAATYEPEARAMAEGSGVRHFLTKPCEPEVILAAVNACLRQEGVTISKPTLDRFKSHNLAPPADPIDPSSVVFVVDDDSDTRTMLSTTLKRVNLKSETFDSAEAFLDGHQGKTPGCLILDMRLPGMSGLELLETLRGRRNHMPVIIVTGHGDAELAVEAARHGIRDFLAKPVESRTLLARVYRALQEDSIKIREQAQSAAMRARMSELTVREKDIVKLLIEGKSSKEIASELHISVKTVSNHRANVMAKTHAINLADLVRMSLGAGEC